MTSEQITTLLSNLVVLIFLGMWIRALKMRISEMKKNIELQNETLEAMHTQVSETEMIGSVYRQFIEELPSEIEKYKTLLTELKNDQIGELKKAYGNKDERLKDTAEMEIKKLELQERSLDDVPALITQFAEIATTITQRFSAVDRLVNSMPPHRSAKWKWLSAFSTIESNLLLIHQDDDQSIQRRGTYEG
ncbi:MAG: hypothetical protein J2P21_04685 [Chloracidobacterium sp.]|nr:hypothetical protein [Chloracidobacterium sp.]